MVLIAGGIVVKMRALYDEPRRSLSSGTRKLSSHNHSGLLAGLHSVSSFYFLLL